jgi:quinoprotein glucose dehydrogenase
MSTRRPPVLSALFACLTLALAALAGAGGVAYSAAAPSRDVEWPSTGNDKGGQRFSELREINRENVSRLRVEWTFATGDAAGDNGSTIECTPIVVNGVMYVTTASRKTHVVALDAATGKQRWRFDPQLGRRHQIAQLGVNRGVAYWEDPRPTGPKRIFLGTADGRLISLDAATGRPAPEFGNAGEVDLRAGQERNLKDLPYGVTSPPAVFEDTVILGFGTGEGPGPAAPGDIRAFDARSGKEVWRFRTVPRPGEFGNETWEGDSWKDRGGANAWGGFTLDARRGIVYCGTGSPTFDFYGGDRKGANLFGNCVLALDARTGLRLWHFQVVRHDLWDYDLPCPPVVTTIKQGEQKVDVVAQVTKTGNCWVLNRLNGRPLFGVEERAVPASITEGEAAHPTQIFPLKPPAFSRQRFSFEDVTDISPVSRAHVLERLKQARAGVIFTPPSQRGTVVLPGFHGGANWSGAAVDPETGTLYVNSNNVPNLGRLEKKDGRWGHAGYNQFRDQDGYPAVKPPWGQLTAIDLAAGEFRWQIPLGEYPELKARGIPQTGTETFGGAIVTAGGLVFIAGTKDERFHAFDKRTGKLLWEVQLPAGGYATPCTYSAGGRQFVVIAAGGGGKLRTKSGDQFVAFALPRG